MSIVGSTEFDSIMADACLKAAGIVSVGGGDIQAIISSIAEGAVDGRETTDVVKKEVGWNEKPTRDEISLIPRS